MEKLLTELARLYLPGAPAADALQAHLEGDAPLALATADGRVRAAMLAFPVVRGQEEGHHWSRLCEVANSLQTRHGLPAPAVSVSGANGYGLWLSLEQLTPVAQVEELLALLRADLMADLAAGMEAAHAASAAPLPPCLHPSTGCWSAFIHPGMGASFADGSGLEIAPPLAGQAALLEGLERIAPAQFDAVLARLRGAQTAAAPAPLPPVATAPANEPAPPAASEGLLLKDATLEDIVRHLHARNIEPTFRFLK